MSKETSQEKSSASERNVDDKDQVAGFEALLVLLVPLLLESGLAELRRALDVLCGCVENLNVWVYRGCGFSMKTPAGEAAREGEKKKKSPDQVKVNVRRC